MSMRLFRTLGCAVALLAAAPFAAQADDSNPSYCDKGFITTLPYTAAAGGKYCLNKNLTTSITTGAAITVTANFVTIDFNNFKLGGGPAGLGTNTVGVAASGVTNVTIRNGNIRGFLKGIDINGPTSANVIENNILDGNTEMGMEVDGIDNVIRNNTISNTGGSTVSIDDFHGIRSTDASVVSGNIVSNLLLPSGTGFTFVDGIDVYNYGVATGNIVRTSYDTFYNTTVYGIFGGSICRDNSIVNADTGNEIFCDSTLDNVTTNNIP